MAIKNPRVKPKRPAPQTTNAVTHASASRGMDSRVSLADFNMDVAIYTYNLMGSEQGMKIREGYREHKIKLVKTSNTGIRTLIPYEGTGTTTPRLFAVTEEGIWDATELGTASPTDLMVDFNDPDADKNKAGIGNYIHYITDAGDSILFYADREYGLFRYNADTNTWARPNITSKDPVITNFARQVNFVASHKQRIWLGVKDSSIGWYLPLSSPQGQATAFRFGQQFKSGGNLVGIYNWSVDGGIGVDDYLIAISSAGDVLPYQGADPETTASNPWQLRGVYFVGKVSDLETCATEFNGDLHILSTFGVVGMSELLKGVQATDIISKSSLGARVSHLLQSDMVDYPLDREWDLDFIPAKGYFIIKTPKRENDIFLQYVYSLTNDSFGWWRDVPMQCVTEWKNVVYIGTPDSRVMSMDIDVDDVKITDDPARPSKAINFSTLFAFNPYDATATFKRGVSIRPDFASTREIAYEAKFVYDYRLIESNKSFSGVVGQQGRWDNGQWDLAFWGTKIKDNKAQLVGGMGIGRTMAIAIAGSSTSDTELFSYDVLWNTGGML